MLARASDMQIMAGGLPIGHACAVIAPQGGHPQTGLAGSVPQGTVPGGVVGVVVVGGGGTGVVGVVVVDAGRGSGAGLAFLHLARRCACLALDFGARPQCEWCFLEPAE